MTRGVHCSDDFIQVIHMHVHIYKVNSVSWPLEYILLDPIRFDISTISRRTVDYSELFTNTAFSSDNRDSVLCRVAVAVVTSSPIPI